MGRMGTPKDQLAGRHLTARQRRQPGALSRREQDIARAFGWAELERRWAEVRASEAAATAASGQRWAAAPGQIVPASSPGGVSFKLPS